MIALETDLGTILAPFWTPKSLQNRSKIGSEPSQNPCSFLNAIQDLQKPFFRPTSPQHDPNLGPKWTRFLGPGAPLWGTWKTPRPQQQLHTNFEPILDRFWTDLGSILNDFLTEFRCFFKNLLFVVCSLLFVACGLLLVVCCLFGVCCLLFAVC